jgi:hypothetical protein
MQLPLVQAYLPRGHELQLSERRRELLHLRFTRAQLATEVGVAAAQGGNLTPQRILRFSSRRLRRPRIQALLRGLVG